MTLNPSIHAHSASAALAEEFSLQGAPRLLLLGAAGFGLSGLLWSAHPAWALGLSLWIGCVIAHLALVLSGQLLRRPLSRQGWGLGLPLLGACLIAGAGVAWQVDMGLSAALQHAADRPSDPLARATLHLGFVGLLLGMPLVQTVRRQAALRRVEAERARVQAELQMLQAQIEPHFLFNTLATLRSLVRQQSDQALPLLDHMTGFLEAVLPQLREPQSSLGRELKILTEYLAIMSLRLQPRLRYRIEVPEALLSTPLPPLLLQPLVENAVLHGVEPCEQGGELTLSACREGSNLLLRVFNTGAPLLHAAPAGVQQGQGLALDNLRQRLQALYGGAAQFQLATVDGGTEACLRLPCATPT